MLLEPASRSCNGSNFAAQRDGAPKLRKVRRARSQWDSRTALAQPIKDFVRILRTPRARCKPPAAHLLDRRMLRFLYDGVLGALVAPQQAPEERMFEAVYTGNTRAVQVLLLEGVDPNACNEVGNRPLHVAAYHGHADVVQVLLEAGAPSWRLQCRMRRGC